MLWTVSGGVRRGIYGKSLRWPSTTTAHGRRTDSADVPFTTSFTQAESAKTSRMYSGGRLWSMLAFRPRSTPRIRRLCSERVQLCAGATRLCYSGGRLWCFQACSSACAVAGVGFWVPRRGMLVECCVAVALAKLNLWRRGFLLHGRTWARSNEPLWVSGHQRNTALHSQPPGCSHMLRNASSDAA